MFVPGRERLFLYVGFPKVALLRLLRLFVIASCSLVLLPAAVMED